MTSQEWVDKQKTTVFCRLQPSAISGVGVFAIRPIAKGVMPFEEVRPTEYITVTKVEVEQLEPVLQKLVLDMCPETDGVFDVPAQSLNEIGVGYYLNHSSTPNMSTEDGVDFVATRDISVGEELTIDYGTYGALNL